MLAQKKIPRSSRNQSVARNLGNARSDSSSPFQIPDNRAETAQLEKVQNTLQMANKNSRRRKNIKGKIKQEQLAIDGSDNRVAQFGENWEILEVADYLKRHQLKQQGTSYTTGKTVMTLTDGSIILIDINQYWRHESGTQENAYYDSSHTISDDNARTHYWTKKGYTIHQAQNS